MAPAVAGVAAMCAACRAVEPLGALHAYVDAPGGVIRCAHCTHVVVRLVAAEGRYSLDARGARCLGFRADA